MKQTNKPDLPQVPPRLAKQTNKCNKQTNARTNKPDLSQVPPRLDGRRAGDTEATSSAVVYLSLVVLQQIFILSFIIDEKISDNLRMRKTVTHGKLCSSLFFH